MIPLQKKLFLFALTNFLAVSGTEIKMQIVMTFSDCFNCDPSWWPTNTKCDLFSKLYYVGADGELVYIAETSKMQDSSDGVFSEIMEITPNDEKTVYRINCYDADDWDSDDFFGYCSFTAGDLYNLKSISMPFLDTFSPGASMTINMNGGGEKPKALALE